MKAWLNLTQWNTHHSIKRKVNSNYIHQCSQFIYKSKLATVICLSEALGRQRRQTVQLGTDWGLRNLQSDRHKWTFHIELMTRVTSHNTHQTHIYLFHSSDSKVTTTPKKTRWRRIGEFGWDGDGMLGKGRRGMWCRYYGYLSHRLDFPIQRVFTLLSECFSGCSSTHREQLITTCSKSLHLRQQIICVGLTIHWRSSIISAIYCRIISSLCKEIASTPFV